MRISDSIKKTRVLYTIPNFDTAGSGKALLNIAKGLDRSRFEPHIMCMHDKGPFFDVVKSSEIPVHLFKYTTEMKPYHKGLVNCWKISREFKRIAPDIIHSFHYSADYSEALAAKMAGIKWLYTKKNMNWGGASKNAWILRTCLAYGIIAQNTEMISKFFHNQKKVVLIPRGIDIRHFFYNPNNIVAKKKTDENSSIKIITIANLVPVKGVELIIKAIAKLSNKYKNLQLTIIGDNNSDYGLSLKELSIEINIEKNIFFEGKIADPLPFIHNSDIFVLSSYKESSPVALLEAMACGIPVLASNTSGAKEIMGDFANQLFTVGSHEELIQQLDNLINMELNCKVELIKRQVNRVVNKFTIDREVLSHEKYYLHLLS